jgi:hypothetical protein
MSPESSTRPADVHVLRWPHGEAELHALAGMLAPVRFRAPGRPDFSPLHVAPWADEPAAGRLWPGALGRLRGEWPCVPFGRTDRPAGLPGDWQDQQPGDTSGHGHGSQHTWQWQDPQEPHALALTIDYPPDQPVEHLTRIVRAVPDAPALDIELHVAVRRACTLPVALHPTLALNQGRVQLEIPHDGPVLTYPVPAEPGHSRLASNTRFTDLAMAPLADGGTTDLTRYPQPANGEDLLQVTGVRGPVTAHYLDAGWSLTLDWDRTQLPDLMMWVSHGGRHHAPWNGRHFALGLEPVNGMWDLGRVTRVPPGHPLAPRTGLQLTPGEPRVIRYRLTANPSANPTGGPTP